MTEFKWTPKAIKGAVNHIPYFEADEEDVVYALDAAVKAQPVVALPPCPTCKGRRFLPAGSEPFPEGTPTDRTCPACNGSGVERMIPESEIRAWIDVQAREITGHEDGYPILNALGCWLDEREAS